MPAPAAGPAPGCRIALVDDDHTVLRSVSRLLTVCGYDVTTFASADAFLASLETVRPEMLLVDLRMPEIDGLALQALLAERGHHIPTVFLSGHGDAATSVRAIRAGAVDFVEKPCDEHTLLASIRRAAEAGLNASRQRDAVRETRERANKLTGREREVIRLVAAGRPDRQIAAMLGSSEKRVEVDRGRAMAKMHATSVADLAAMLALLESEPSRAPSLSVGALEARDSR